MGICLSDGGKAACRALPFSTAAPSKPSAPARIAEAEVLPLQTPGGNNCIHLVPTGLYNFRGRATVDHKRTRSVWKEGYIRRWLKISYKKQKAGFVLRVLFSDLKLPDIYSAAARRSLKVVTRVVFLLIDTYAETFVIQNKGLSPSSPPPPHLWC